MSKKIEAIKQKENQNFAHLLGVLGCMGHTYDGQVRAETHTKKKQNPQMEVASRNRLLHIMTSPSNTFPGLPGGGPAPSAAAAGRPSGPPAAGPAAPPAGTAAASPSPQTSRMGCRPATVGCRAPGDPPTAEPRAFGQADLSGETSKFRETSVQLHTEHPPPPVTQHCSAHSQPQNAMRGVG